MDFSVSTANFMRIIKINLNKGIQNTQILQNYRLISAYRRQNLRDYLVKAKVQPLIKARFKTKTDLYTTKWINNLNKTSR